MVKQKNLTIRQGSRIYHKLKDRAGLVFYRYPCKYRVEYRVSVINKAKRTNLTRVILPLPIESEYQKILDGPFFSGGNFFTSREERHGNKFVVFERRLNTGDSLVITEKFGVKVWPRQAIVEDLQVEDYRGCRAGGEYKKYLMPNRYLDSDNFVVKKLYHKIAEKNSGKISEIVRMFYNYVVDNIKYGKPIEGLYSAKDVLREECVDCGGFCSLLGSLYKIAGIPSRIVSGFWAGYERNNMHVWLEFMLPNGSWVPADPSADSLFRSGRSYKSGGLGFVGSDRIALSRGCDFELMVLGKNDFKIDILQNPVVRAGAGDKSLSAQNEFLVSKWEKQ